MESFLHVHNVFAAFRNCLYTFGRRSTEAEFSFPAHSTQPLVEKSLACKRIGGIELVILSIETRS